MVSSSSLTEEEKIKQAIQALEAQRSILGDAVIESALQPLQEKLASLQARVLGEQRKVVTVLFADLVGFTDLSSKMDAEDVREILNIYFERWSKCIQQQDGVVEKFIGDAVMAVFGLPAAREDDPERAVHAALEMQQELNRLNPRLEQEHGIRLEMRVGINTGEVVVSLLGERMGEEFIVVGDMVNLTSRLQSAAPPGGILVTQDTYRFISSLFETESFGSLQPKGFAQPVQAYRIIQAKPRVFQRSGRGIEGVQAPLVGRESELDLLRSSFDDVVRQQQCRLVLLVGEAGLGKSRLLHEFTGWLAQTAEPVALLFGRAYPSGQYTPYALVRALLASHTGIQDSDSPEIVRHKLEQTIGLGAEKSAVIARLLGFEIGATPYDQELRADAAAFFERATAYLGEYLRVLSVERACVLFFEDLHWADDSSLAWLRQLPAQVAGKPFLILAAARPALFERDAGWGAEITGFTRLPLAPLPEDASRQLIGMLLNRVESLPETLRSLLVTSSEGNPYYIEELIKMLMDDGVIVQGDEHWQVMEQRLSEVRIPPTLVAVLQARFDSLSHEDRDVLQKGAVIGRVFWDRAVTALSKSTPSPPVYSRLRSKEMIYQNKPSSLEEAVEYSFKHTLLRDVTYNSLLKKQRREYHRLTAQWLEGIIQRTHRTGEFSVLLAGHYEQAGEAEKAAAWYLQAGKLAAERFANQEALHAFHLALDLHPEGDSAWQVSVLAERLKVFHLLGRRAEQLADIERMDQIAQDSADLELQAAVAFLRAEYAFLTSQYDQTLEYGEKAIDLAQQANLKELEARSNVLLAGTYIRQGKQPLAEECARKALVLSKELGLLSLAAESHRSLGLAAYFSGSIAQAAEQFAQTLHLFEQAGDRRGKGLALLNLGGAAFETGAYSEAGQYYKRSLDICREIGDRLGEGRALNNLGIISMTQEQFAQAEAYYLQALQIAREVGNMSTELSNLDNLGNTALVRYQVSKAIRYQQEAQQKSLEIGDQLNLSTTLVNRAIAYIFAGDYQEAFQIIQECITINQQVGDKRRMCDTMTLLGLCYARAGEYEQGLVAVSEGVKIAKQEGMRSFFAWASGIRGEIFGHLHRYIDSLEDYRQSIAVHQELKEQNEALEAQAGMSLILLDMGEIQHAYQLAQTIYALLSQKSSEGFTRPVRNLLACYLVFKNVGDSRAGEVLQKGYNLMESIAANIDEEKLRRTFYEAVPENRALLAAWMETDPS